MVNGMEDGVISPYEGLEPRAFWKSGVSGERRFPLPEIYRPKFAISQTVPILTAGSCFAQHVGRALRRSGFAVLDEETLPAGVPDPIAQSYGYRLYSARYGNIYTMRQFLQLLQEAHGTFSPAEPIWEKNGAYFDALRPNVFPGGLANPDMVVEMRALHLEAVRRAVAKAGLVVFTLGLTEAWVHAETDTVYPTAPGTIAGKISDDYRFVNFRAAEIREDFIKARELLRSINPDMQFLLTVSPVPLTATASGNHVLPATVYSKSVLRAVAGELVEDFDDVDYFPSYELVASHPSAARYFDRNLRTVHRRGVKQVMSAFLRAQADEAAVASQPVLETQVEDEYDDDGVVCEEELLEAFRK